MNPKTIIFAAPKAEPASTSAWFFLALSRTPHVLVDIAMPAVAALLYLGAFPPMKVILLGLVAAFAGYTAVYALNDLVDHEIDREKLAYSGFDDSGKAEGYLDSLLTRHPVALGLLGYKAGLIWAVGWAMVSFVAAYMLNPVCAFILCLGAALEFVYCVTVRMSQLRILVSGTVKTMGAMAAVFAVDPHPSPVLTLLLFTWIFFWEIGGQKLPADWHDIEEDRQVGAKTIPAWLGKKITGAIILIALAVTVAINAILLAVSPAGSPLWWFVPAAGIWLFLLLSPALRLNITLDQNDVSVFFTRSSWYPMAMLIIVGIRIMII